MTVEERLKLIIGDLVISRCALETRIEELEAKIKAREDLEATISNEMRKPSMFKQTDGDDVYSHREHASALRAQEIKQAAE